MVALRRILVLLLFLISLAVDVSGQEDLMIRKIVFTGNDTLSGELLLNQMNTKPRTLMEKLKFWKKSDGFSSFVFDDDLLRIKKYYQRNGFLNPSITYKLVPNKRNKKLDILIDIEKGNAVITRRIDYQLLGDSVNIGLFDSLQKVVPLKPLTRFRDDYITVARKIIINKFSRIGYPFVNVDNKISLIENMQKADISVVVSSGNKTYFGDVKLRGDSLIPVSFINKHIKIKKGDVFSHQRLEKTQQKLFDLSLFRYVTIRAMIDSVRNDSVPIVIQLSELPRWSLKCGLGYGTEDRVRVSMLLKRLNFLGGARTLILKAEHSYFRPINAEVKFIQPNIWGKNLDLILNPFYMREREESYRVDRLGTLVTFQKNITPKSTAYISYTYGKDKVKVDEGAVVSEDENLEDKRHNKSGVTLGYIINNTNDYFSPTRGLKINALATYMGVGFKTDYHYYKIMGEVAYFRPLGRGVVFAGKLKSGTITATQGDNSTPIEDRFLMGGALSLRGWGRNQISPIDQEGNKFGGNSMMEGIAELRYPLFGIFSGAVFMEMGNVWKKSWQFNVNNMHYDAGVGLRIKTPVGPIRLDVATPIGRDAFDIQFFVTIGHAF